MAMAFICPTSEPVAYPAVVMPQSAEAFPH
jgi:hypothetical protein